MRGCPGGRGGRWRFDGRGGLGGDPWAGVHGEGGGRVMEDFGEGAFGGAVRAGDSWVREPGVPRRGGVRGCRCGCAPPAGSLPALVLQHSIRPMSLPCVLRIPCSGACVPPTPPPLVSPPHRCPTAVSPRVPFQTRCRTGGAPGPPTSAPPLSCCVREQVGGRGMGGGGIGMGGGRTGGSGTGGIGMGSSGMRGVGGYWDGERWDGRVEGQGGTVG